LKGDDCLTRIQGIAVKGELCYVTALFICDYLQIKTPIRFVIDTGSVHTTLAEHKARELNIDTSILSQKVKIETRGIGGIGKAHYLGGVRLVFSSTNGEEIEEKLNCVHILENPPPRSDKDIKAYEAIPNLLGLDVLRNYTIHFKKNNVYLEKE
jgi:hypothetical protein